VAKAAALRIRTKIDGRPVAIGRTHVMHGSHAPRLLRVLRVERIPLDFHE
jgi:hypothetical protein